MITIDLAPGTGVPVHRHLVEDEIIDRGEGPATLREDQYLVKTSATVFVPPKHVGRTPEHREALIMLAFREIGQLPGARDLYCVRRW